MVKFYLFQKYLKVTKLKVKYAYKKITKDTDLISKSGIFSFVNQALIEDKDGFIVVYKIKPKYRLRKLIINGAEKISNKKIKEKVILF